MTRTATTRRDLEEFLRDAIEGDEGAVEAVIADLIGQTARYEDCDVEALIWDGQSRVIALMGVEDWR